MEEMLAQGSAHRNQKPQQHRQGGEQQELPCRGLGRVFHLHSPPQRNQSPLSVMILQKLDEVGRVDNHAASLICLAGSSPVTMTLTLLSWMELACSAFSRLFTKHQPCQPLPAPTLLEQMHYVLCLSLAQLLFSCSSRLYAVTVSTEPSLPHRNTTSSVSSLPPPSPNLTYSLEFCMAIGCTTALIVCGYSFLLSEALPHQAPETYSFFRDITTR